MSTRTSIVPTERIQGSIHEFRGCKVMLDSDLALLYGVVPKALNQAVGRNIERFPADFMFQLTAEEAANLRSQGVTSSARHGGRRYLPYVFTELGVSMLSSVLRSPKAIAVNMEIMRTFVELRRHAITYEELRKRISTLESKTDRGIKKLMDAIEKLMEPDAHKPTLGFARKKVR